MLRVVLKKTHFIPIPLLTGSRPDYSLLLEMITACMTMITGDILSNMQVKEVFGLKYMVIQ